MNRLSVLLLLLILHASLAPAQMRMREYIVQMPDSVLPLLTSVNRADCVDFVEAGMEAKVTNRLGGTTELTALTDDYALWQYTSLSQVEMKLLPFADSTYVICMVSTVLQPVPDSDIAFYDKDWAPLPTSRFVAPLQPAAPLSALRTVRLSLSPDSLMLKVECRTESFELTDVDATMKSAREERVLIWDGRAHFSVSRTQ